VGRVEKEENRRKGGRKKEKLVYGGWMTSPPGNLYPVLIATKRNTIFAGRGS